MTNNDNEYQIISGEYCQKFQDFSSDSAYGDKERMDLLQRKTNYIDHVSGASSASADSNRGVSSAEDPIYNYRKGDKEIKIKTLDIIDIKEDSDKNDTNSIYMNNKINEVKKDEILSENKEKDNKNKENNNKKGNNENNINKKDNLNKKIKFITYKKKGKRKDDKDLKIKKIKGKFFKYIIKKLNEKLENLNIEGKFNHFSKRMIECMKKTKFKQILELTVIKFLNYEELNKIDNKIIISENNKRLYEKLKNRNDCNYLFQNALNDKRDDLFLKTLKDLYVEYLKSDDFQCTIKKFKPKVKSDDFKCPIDKYKSKYEDYYINSYKKIAEEDFINYFFPDEKKSSNKEEY